MLAQEVVLAARGIEIELARELALHGDEFAAWIPSLA